MQTTQMYTKTIDMPDLASIYPCLERIGNELDKKIQLGAIITPITNFNTAKFPVPVSYIVDAGGISIFAEPFLKYSHRPYQGYETIIVTSKVEADKSGLDAILARLH